MNECWIIRKFCNFIPKDYSIDPDFPFEQLVYQDNDFSIVFRNFHNPDYRIKLKGWKYDSIIFEYIRTENKVCYLQRRRQHTKNIDGCILDDSEELSDLELILKYGRVVTNDSFLKTINETFNLDISLEEKFFLI